MTAMPDHILFDDRTVIKTVDIEAECAQVSDRFWGYQISMTQSELASSAIIRLAASLICVVFALAAAAVAVFPQGSLVFAPSLSNGTVMFGLGVSSAVAYYVACQCRRVRVEIDTSLGEIRQVLSGRFSPEALLTCHGLDSVSSVEVVASKFDRSFGQIHVCIRDYGTIAVADGQVAALRRLCRRIRADVGLTAGHKTQAVWSGPLKAS